MKSDEEFMRLAIAEARRAFEEREVPVGAVAIYQGQVIGRGHNCKETQRDPTAHAEVIALREAARFLAGWRLPAVDLYCTMEPCSMCAGAMIQARIHRLIYAVDDPKAGAAGSLIDLLQHQRFNHQVKVDRGILAAEVQQMLAAFFQGLRQGTIARQSEAWKQSSQLAKNTESV